MCRKIVTGISLVLASALTAAAANVGDYYHPKLKQREIVIRRVIIFPSKLQLQKETMKGGQSMAQETEKLEPVFDRALIAALRNSSLTVSDASPTNATLSANPDVLESVDNEQKNFDSISPAMMKHMKDVRKGRFKLPEDALEKTWNEKERSDTFVFVRGFGEQVTKSRGLALGGLTGALIAGSLNVRLMIAFVDTNSGDVLLVKNVFLEVKKKDTEGALTQRLNKAFKNNVKRGGFGAA